MHLGDCTAQNEDGVEVRQPAAIGDAARGKHQDFRRPPADASSNVRSHFDKQRIRGVQPLTARTEAAA